MQGRRRARRQASVFNSILIFAPEDPARLHSFAEVVRERDEKMSEEQVAAIRKDVVATVTCYWRYGDSVLPWPSGIAVVAGWLRIAKSCSPP